MVSLSADTSACAVRRVFVVVVVVVVVAVVVVVVVVVVCVCWSAHVALSGHMHIRELGGTLNQWREQHKVFGYRMVPLYELAEAFDAANLPVASQHTRCCFPNAENAAIVQEFFGEPSKHQLAGSMTGVQGAPVASFAGPAHVPFESKGAQCHFLLVDISTIGLGVWYLQVL
jgi:hypothetical protein